MFHSNGTFYFVYCIMFDKFTDRNSVLSINVHSKRLNISYLRNILSMYKYTIFVIITSNSTNYDNVKRKE